MKEIKYASLVLVSIIILASCQKIQHAPAIPSIEFTSFTVFDTLDPLGNNSKGGRLKFKFEDGDGDLGLNSPTVKTPDSTNLYLSLYRKIGGTMVPVPGFDPLLPYAAYRIPYMERLGQNKILKGTISVTMIYQSYTAGDTIKYDFYITDRALNESNIVSTNEIIIAKNNTYK
jgi:hypothetical protein